MHRTHTIAALTSCLCATLTTHAQDFSDENELLGFYGDEEVISIATGTKQRVSKAPAVASVITASDIARLGASDIDEVLESIPGLHIDRASLGYNPIYTFRGVRSNYNPQVLTLINGIPTTTLFHGGRHLINGGTPVTDIARIEVIRGPGSAVYGADAFSGVINIITKTRQDINGTEFGVRAGSDNTRDAWLLHGSDIGAIELALSAEFQKTDGYDAHIESDAQTNLDALTGTQASNAPSDASLSRENWDLRLDLSYQAWRLRAGQQRRRDFGLGAGVADALDPSSRYKSDRNNIDISYHNPNFTDDWEVKATVSYLYNMHEHDKDLIIFPAGVNLGQGVYPQGVIGNPEIKEHQSRFDISAFYTGIERHNIRVGSGYFYGDMYEVKETKNFGPDPATGIPLPPDSGLVDVSDTPYVFINENTRQSEYLFVQDIWQLADDWELTTGLRYDNYSDFGSTTNPRLALVWSTNLKLTTKLLYAQAFRAPSFSETYSINNPITLGNPDIKPEEMESLELAFNYKATENIRFGLNLFHYEWQDIINFIPDAAAASNTAQNIGEQTGDGFETEMDWSISDQLSLSANYSFVDAQDPDTNTRISKAPRQQFYANVNWAPLPKWNLSGELNWVMDREREEQDLRKDIDDYKVVNINLRHQQKHWYIQGSVRNLFADDAREPSNWSLPSASIKDDLPIAGRQYRLEISYQFN